MIDVNEYYSAEKARGDTKKMKEKLADQTFYGNMERYKLQYNDMISTIQHKVSKGLSGFVYLPYEPEHYSYIIKSHHIIPQDDLKFTTAQNVVFTLLKTLGYNVMTKRELVFFDGMDKTKDSPIEIQEASISWA